MIHFKSSAGTASLTTVIALMILILAIVVGISALSLTEIVTSAGQSQSSQALAYAEAGARDALIRLSRNKNYTCAATDCYSIAFVTDGCSTNDGCARISVGSGAGTSGDPKIVTSTGQVKTSVRRIRVDVIFDSSLNGEIATTTWRELTD